MKTHVKTTIRRRSALALGAALAWCLGLNLEPALAGEGSWMRRANLPMTMFVAAGCEVDGILYLAGGQKDHTTPSPLQTMLAYDPKTDRWTRKADMPTARAYAAAVAVDGLIYVIGGGNMAYTVTKAVEAYDPKTDTWTAKAPLPSARGDMPACVVDGLIYVLGGLTFGPSFMSRVDCYDPKTDQWTRKRDLPEACGAQVGQVMDGLIYLFTSMSTFAYDPKTDQWTRKASLPPGGLNSWNAMGGAVDGTVCLFGGFSEDITCATDFSLAYDPVQDRFTARREMPAPLDGAASATIGGKIYIAGGESGHPTKCPGSVRCDSLWVFDPQGGGTPGSWTQKADMPAAVGGAAACEVNGTLYLAGGELSPGNPVGTLYAYDPSTDGWTQRSQMATPRVFPVAGAVDGIVYVIGGGNIVTGVFTDAVEAYDPATDTWTTKTAMPTRRGDMAACTLGGLIYVMGGMTAGGTYAATVECYDPKTDQWTRKANLPETSVAAVAQAADDLIYLFAGTSTFVYDPQTDDWTRKAPAPAGSLDSWNSMAGMGDGLLYVLGGLIDSSPYCAHALTFAYDPAQHRFTPRRMLPKPCFAAAFATIDGKVYVAGGISGNPTRCPSAVYYNNLWMFDPQGGVAPYILRFTHPSDDTVRLAWQGEAGRLYGVKYTLDPATGPWLPFTLSNGSTTIRATKAVVEATGTVPASDTARYFRVYEAD